VWNAGFIRQAEQLRRPLPDESGVPLTVLRRAGTEDENENEEEGA
jgi:hypothetical protein